MFELLMIAVLLGLIPAVIAQRKGESFVVWWIYGALLFIVALPHALLTKANPKAIESQALQAGGKKCPFCAEVIKAEAKACKHCGRDVEPASAPRQAPPVPPGPRTPFTRDDLTSKPPLTIERPGSPIRRKEPREWDISSEEPPRGPSR